MSLFVSSDMSVLSVQEEGNSRSGASKSLAVPSFPAGADSHTRRNEMIGMDMPQTRLVSRPEYLATQLGKGQLYATAVVIGCIGVMLLAYTLYNGLHDAFASHGQVNTLLFLLSEAIFMGGIGAAALWYAGVTFASAKKLEAVAPIAQHNTGDRPEFETLVRAYASNPSQQNVELLRAAMDNFQTPAN